MHRGIDSYFKKQTASAPETGAKKESTEKPRKRKARIISSDEDDDVVAASPITNKKSAAKKTRTDPSPKTPKPTTESGGKKPALWKLNEMKRVDPSALFGGEPVRVAAKKAPQPKEAAVIDMEDEEIDCSLLEIDMSTVILSKPKENGKAPKKRDASKEKKTSSKEAPREKTPRKEAPREKTPRDETPRKETPRKETPRKETPRKETPSKQTPKKETPRKDTPRRETNMKETSKKETPKKEKTPKEATTKIPEHSPAKKLKLEITEPKVTPKVEKKTVANATPKGKKASAPKSDLDTSVLTDEERFERRRYAAQAYKQYQKRPACLNAGSKTVPKGKPNCFAGLSFLVTGVLESLERDGVKDIVIEYGGKMMTTAGKQLKYLIVGEEPGFKKLEQAQANGTQIITEDEFLNLIRQKSGEKIVKVEQTPTPSPKATKNSRSPAAKKTNPKPAEVKQEPKPAEVKQGPKPAEVKQEPKPVKKLLDALNNNSEANLPKRAAIDEESMAWVDKYKPASVNEIIGQHGAGSNVSKLTNWLSRWYANHDGKTKLTKPSPWAKNDDGAYFKAALLSGPPGIGKTTTATLVCQQLGFDTVEFNASDTRSKRLLKEQVAELLSNKSLYGFCHGQAQAVTKKHVLLMDEVDGMAGNEDRGGIQELIALIKDSSVPIICMCNDRNHQKMRSLVNYCYDLRFAKPRMQQIKGCLLSICCKENFNLDGTKLIEIIAASNFDIRQSINHLALMSAGKHLNLKSSQAGGGAGETAQKDMKLGPWDVVRKVFSAEEHKQMSFADKCDLFFHDYSMSPLFVQQNYLQVSSAVAKKEVLQRVALTADALSLGDLAERRIRSSNAWSLLPAQAVFSSVMPGEYMSGHFTGQINFPGWLGKYSRANKRNRLAQEIHDHTRICTSGSKRSVRMEYAPFLVASIARPLREHGLEGVPQALAVLKEYHLLREDIESLIELSSWPGRKGPMDAVDGRVKAALTRAYNKEVLPYSYSAIAGIKKKKAEASDEMLPEDSMMGEEGEYAVNVIESDEEDKDADALEHDGLIKAKKSTAATTGSKGGNANAKKSASGKGGATSKAKASGSKSKK